MYKILGIIGSIASIIGIILFFTNDEVPTNSFKIEKNNQSPLINNGNITYNQITKKVSKSNVDLKKIDFFKRKKKNICKNTNILNPIYITDNAKDKLIFSTFWSDKEQFITSTNAKVSIWTSDKNLVESCTNSSAWKRISSLSPGKNQEIIAIGSNCRFNKPKNKNKRYLQFVYSIGYYDILKNEGKSINDWNLEYYQSVLDIRNRNPKIKHFDNVGFANLRFAEETCYNVELRYCGDGIISNGEECDFGIAKYSKNCDKQTCKFKSK